MLMTDLNQFMVREGTYAVRRFRKKRSIIAKIDASLRDEISRQTIEPSVTNMDLTNFTLEPTEDTGDEQPKRILEDDIRWTLQYLSLLKSQDGAHPKASFSMTTHPLNL